ncbi:MAG: 23S rRNA (uracil(1939)-C(5))-methyltransferase RlmD [Saprospiraceae bacterium]|nr:23S rRNA (uracil(1939)-C(5))-methyltransferase RlmD [Saprospiraceae bacterium]
MGRSRKKPRIQFEDLEITRVADKGKGIGLAPDGRVVFVEKVAKGDVVDVRVSKKNKDYYEAFPLQYKKYSADRIEPFCEHYGVCGGCQLQHISYATQLEYKQEVVDAAIRRIGKVKVNEILPIVGAEQTVYYRNKLEYAYSNKRWLSKEEIESEVDNEEKVLGYHRPRAFDKIVKIHHCYHQENPSNAIRDYLVELAKEQDLSCWDARKNVGFLRNIMMRVLTTGDVMLLVAFSENDQEKIKAYLDAILAKFPTITTLLYCVNQKVNDFLLDLDMIVYHGPGFITEQLGHVKFKIGPKSFFQTNTRQAKVLYDKVVEFADLKGHENVYDLYTGLGSIAQYVAHNCKTVVGIEEIAAAIEDAKENASLNGIDNCTFYAGDVKDILDDSFAERHGKPDLVITDPPRAGMHAKVVETLLKLEAPRIVYVSCNPATQARDINLLDEKYEVVKLQPVDMFPNTHHIETVALLQLKK